MAEFTTYLKKLTFDKKLENSLFAKYVKNTRLVILLMILTIFVGIGSYMAIPRVLNPDINIPYVIVSTVLPGASPSDVETLVTVPVEDSVNGITGLKTMTSSSKDSVSVVTLQFESGVNADKAKNDVQSAVDTITSLPEDAKKPNVAKLDFTNEPIWTFTLSSKDNDTISLVRFGRKLRDALKNLPSIEKVETTGLDNQEIQIIIDQEKMASYGLTAQTVSQAITSALGSYPAGTVKTEQSSFVVSIDPTITTVDDVRQIQISTQGTPLAISKIATVQEKEKPSVAKSYIASTTQKPTETIRFDIYKTKSVNITKAEKDARECIEATQKPYGDQFIVSSVLNSSDLLSRQFHDLVRDFTLIVTLVFVILFLFLGARQALVASAAIPLTFLITFIVMHLAGISLSFIAYFSLLLSLGLLVDDTIVVISAITAYYRTGKFTPLEATLLVWRDFKTAILTTTLTTVWAFVPLLLTSGIIGEFIKAIPIVVSSTLLASFIVALFLTLPIIIIFLKGDLPKRVVILIRILGLILLCFLFCLIAPKGMFLLPALALFIVNIIVYTFVKKQLQTAIKKKVKNILPAHINKKHKPFSYYIDHGVVNFENIENKYRSILSRMLATKTNRRKTVLSIVVLSLFSFSLLPLGFVRNEFFPKSDQEVLYISLEMPSGTNSQTTKTEMLKILDEVRTVNDVTFVTATMNMGYSSTGFTGGNENVALITFVLPEENKRKKTSMDIASTLRDKYASYTKGTLSVIEASDGPPAGSDLQIKLSGDDLLILDQYANEIKSYLQSEKGITNIEKSIKPGTSKIVFVPDYEQMIAYGVTQQQINSSLRTYASGSIVKEDAKLQKETNEKTDIIIRTNSSGETVSDITAVTIPTQQGVLPITTFGKFVLKPNPTLITREEGKRTLSVSAGVEQGYSISESNKNLETFAKSLQLSDGYTWSTGGVNEENNKSVQSILQAMLLSFFLIIVTMVLQFSSFRKAFIVMLVIPLSISGVFILFALTHTVLSFPALIGILALFGIVVKNAILVVDKINQNQKEKMNITDSIIDGSASRLEPIALTSFATIVGLIPITLSNPLWQGLGGAIIAGLFFSGALMLFFIPVVYYLFFAKSEK